MLRTLTEIGRRAWQIIESGIRSGIDKDRIFQAVRSIFTSYKEEEYIKDFKTLSQAVIKWREAEFYPEDRPLPTEYFEPTKLPTPRAYMVTVRGRLINEQTGEETVVRYTLGFDRVPSRREVLETALEAFNQRLRTGETNWRFEFDRIEKLYRGF